MVRHMRTSKLGLDLIKSFEGYRARAVELPDGRWSIGYAHTQSARKNLRITRADAEAVLREYDLPPVERSVGEAVLAPLNQNEFDALVSFAFNIGQQAFANSEVLVALNSGKRLAAADAMGGWRHARLNGQLVEVDALVRRRVMEQGLFLKHPAGMPKAPSDMIRPVLGMKSSQDILFSPPGQTPPRTFTPQPPEKPKPTANTRAAKVETNSTRLTRELGTEKPSKEMETSRDTQLGPTPDEITRAISALANPDGDTAQASDEPEDKLYRDGQEHTVPSVSPPPFDDNEDELPPVSDLSELEYFGEDISGSKKVVIDDLEPAQIDPILLKRAALDAGTDGGDQRSARSLSFLSWFLGALGLGTFATGSYFFRVHDNSSTASVESAAQAMSVGGILFGILLMILAVFIAYRSGK